MSQGTKIRCRTALILAVVLAALLFIGTKPAEAQSQLEFEPQPVDFGGVEVNTTSDPAFVVITNSLDPPFLAPSTVRINRVRFLNSLDRQDDFILLTPAVGLTLAPGQSKIIQVAFRPSAEGSTGNTAFEVMFEDVKTGTTGIFPGFAELTGQGVAPSATNTKPTVTIEKPAGEKVKTTKPTIIGTVHDNEQELTEANIRIFLQRISAPRKEVTNFTYDQATDKVQFKSDKRLQNGQKYLVKIMVTDEQGLTTSTEKIFKVIKVKEK
jgi:hypothetical protein